MKDETALRGARGRVSGSWPGAPSSSSSSSWPSWPSLPPIFPRSRSTGSQSTIGAVIAGRWRGWKQPGAGREGQASEPRGGVTGPRERVRGLSAPGGDVQYMPMSICSEAALGGGWPSLALAGVRWWCGAIASDEASVQQLQSVAWQLDGRIHGIKAPL